MKISLRLPSGWSTKVENKDKEKCDFCGAKLWIDPGDQIYRDAEHNPKVEDADLR
jgi:predicted amidohydrolase